MDTQAKNFTELWEAKRDEYDAKAERLDAGQRLRYNNAFDDLEEEMSAGADWTEAAFKELVAKANKKWQEFALDIN